jgi:superfamily II DNA/RNA helicase
MIAQSQSGTGKTAAFVLAMLSRVDPKKEYPQVSCHDQNMLNRACAVVITTGAACFKITANLK